jgi:hypothetical protein
MVFSVWSTTEVTVSHLEITIIIKKEEIATGQVKRHGGSDSCLEGGCGYL